MSDGGTPNQDFEPWVTGYLLAQVNIFSNNRDIRQYLENSKSKKGHNFVKKNWRITSSTGMGSPFDSE